MSTYGFIDYNWDGRKETIFKLQHRACFANFYNQFAGAFHNRTVLKIDYNHRTKDYVRFLMDMFPMTSLIEIDGDTFISVPLSIPKNLMAFILFSFRYTYENVHAIEVFNCIKHMISVRNRLPALLFSHAIFPNRNLKILYSERSSHSTYMPYQLELSRVKILGDSDQLLSKLYDSPTDRWRLNESICGVPTTMWGKQVDKSVGGFIDERRGMHVEDAFKEFLAKVS